ncbi:hypothetical protein MTR67_012122 [Solanum verrucosum]|uniref:Reverse transcriptase RNase H-like domain-containing protein n=1 Tax=Solanum verrucosum TaxID=315347 RepID=A0AAF0Q989_SOLVR|nr:hypothetical protein MTR67_012122 [Solanum verrucosum]
MECCTTRSGVPNSPGVQPQGEVTNVEFREVIQVLSQVVTNHVGKRENRHEVDDTSRIREFLRMKLPSFTDVLTDHKSLQYVFSQKELNLRQKRWLELLRDYDMSILYHTTYELELRQKLATVHPVFHISMLKKVMGDPSLIIPTEDIGIKDSLSFEDIPVQILDRQVHKLRIKEVASVKVLWRNQFVEEATWKAEKDMKKRYTHIFEPREIPDQGTNSLLSTL